MKSKEAVKYFIEAKNQIERENFLVEIIDSFHHDFIKIYEARKIKSDEGLFKLMNDTEKKFQKFTSLVNEHYKDSILHNEFFKKYTVKFFGENIWNGYVIWKKSNEINKNYDNVFKFKRSDM